MSTLTDAEFWQRYLEERSIPEPNSGCWLWLKATSNYGYGSIGTWINAPRFRNAHRLSYAVFRHDPGELQVLHRCDTPACVNPGHLFLGSAKDNMQDCSRKGRLKLPPPRDQEGVKNKMAKLTPHIAALIRLSDGSNRQVAERFGVSAATVSCVKTGKRWAT
jgi:hypothetical protein